MTTTTLPPNDLYEADHVDALIINAYIDASSGVLIQFADEMGVSAELIISGIIEMVSSFAEGN